jgi:hypothetical protein
MSHEFLENRLAPFDVRGETRPSFVHTKFMHAKSGPPTAPISPSGFSLGPVTSASTTHAPVGDFNLVSGVVSQGVRFGCGISVSGDGLLDLITVRLGHRGIGQQQSECTGK